MALNEATPTEWVRPAADLLRAHDTEGWFYGDSIGFEALFAASDLLHDPTYAAYAHGFFRAWRTRAEPFRELDSTAPGHAMCLAYERTGDGLVLDGALRLARWLRSRRSLDGVYVSRERIPLRPPAGVARMEPVDAALLSRGSAGVLVDCLHFDPPFFAHLGHLTADAELIDLGVDQALGYGRLLQDESTGLFSHFYLEATAQPYALGWTRGQAWALCGMLDVLEYCGNEHPGRGELIERCQRLASALASHQREDGHWFAVSQEPESGEESSGAAFGAYQFWRGVAAGILDREEFDGRARRAWAAASQRVGQHGELRMVSAAVGVSTVLAHYGNVSLGQVVPWGQGPLILAEAQRVGIGAGSGLPGSLPHG